MSGWGRSFFSGGASRFSPFGRQQYDPGVVTDEDFSYITASDLQESSMPVLETEDDVLLIKNKGVTYPIKFPAYSIGDGKLQVRDVKDRAAIALDVPSGRSVELLYKGQQLNEDFTACREYGLKNQSEILCVVDGDDSGFALGRSNPQPEESAVKTNSKGPARGLASLVRKRSMTDIGGIAKRQHNHTRFAISHTISQDATGDHKSRVLTRLVLRKPASFSLRKSIARPPVEKSSPGIRSRGYLNSSTTPRQLQDVSATGENHLFAERDVPSTSLAANSRPSGNGPLYNYDMYRQQTGGAPIDPVILQAR
jgi:hypothetical protein